MREKLSPQVENARIVIGSFKSGVGSGPQGAFKIRFRHRKGSQLLNVIASDGRDWPLAPPVWEHVSVSCKNRCPTWNEMSFIRHCFFKPEETVLQLHVPLKKHINLHPNTLHLWRPVGVDIVLPPEVCV